MLAAVVAAAAEVVVFVLDRRRSRDRELKYAEVFNSLAPFDPLAFVDLS